MAHPQSEFLILNNLGLCVGLTDEYRVEQHGGFETPPLIPSVCNECKLVMPKIWNTICSRCRKAHCYQHSKAINGMWVCPACDEGAK
jgi:hypothetical protein